MSKKLLRLLAVLLAMTMVVAACGSDSGSDDAGSDDTTSTDDDGAEEEGADDEAMEEGDDDGAMEEGDDDGAMEEGGDELATSGSVDIAAGTTLDLDACPDDWSATTGVEGDEIILGQTLPQSGALAPFGAIGEGMQMYFDYVNDNDPIEGKNITLVSRDDAYEAGRAVANVEEMIDSDDIFAFTHIIGTPINLAVRPITDENCIPQLFNSSGFPFWGDPANFPWTVGNILNYVTETEIWCAAAIEEFGEGATVAGLFMNNDFGVTYQKTLNDSPACAGLEIVAEELHDPAADSIQNEMTTIIASDAQVFLAGTTSGFCPQSTGAVAASEWRPRFYASYTCNNLSSFFAPVQDAAGLLADDGAGVRMANSNKICGDPNFADDPAILLIEEVLAEYGDVTCADGSYSTGVLYGQFVESVLREAAALPGGLNRVNLMAATWNIKTTNDTLLGGTLQLDGVNDAYWTEAAQIQEIQVIDGTLGFVGVGDIVDFEGEGGSYGG